MSALRFHTLAQLVSMHRDQIMRYGGTPGIRDTALCASAALLPRVNSGGMYCHPSIPEMAAAYLFHIITSRPFYDGNRRVGIVSAVTFLYLNGYGLSLSGEALYELADGVSIGRMGKSEVAVTLAANTMHA